MWFEVLKICRVKCGIAKPIKAIGPVKAVIVPAVALPVSLIASFLGITETSLSRLRVENSKNSFLTRG